MTLTLVRNQKFAVSFKETTMLGTGAMIYKKNFKSSKVNCRFKKTMLGTGAMIYKKNFL
jgi:hypothetical protein